MLTRKDGRSPVSMSRQAKTAAPGLKSSFRPMGAKQAPASSITGMIVTTSLPPGGSLIMMLLWGPRTIWSFCMTPRHMTKDCSGGASNAFQTSEGLTPAHSGGGFSSWMWNLRRLLSHDAPCTLNTPTSPPTSLRFQILRGVAPSHMGSLKSTSIVGLPGIFGRRTVPSGSTSLLRRSKSCSPGLSLTYTAEPLAARAAACSSAAGWRLWNMSQSGWTRAPRKSELNAAFPMWEVWLAGSQG
mmetsp:Transcript_3367/g.7974  ORF Transcript_3367/g.7974 Transcript_3367/m.7974 type:complete len:242 (+) Transcript_3367:172-897(+)